MMNFANPIPPWYRMTMSKFKNKEKRDYISDSLSGVTVRVHQKFWPLCFTTKFNPLTWGFLTLCLLDSDIRWTLVTVGLVRLPQAMAHGMLSDMPIQYGIYTDLYGCIFYSIFTSSRHSSAGSTAFLMMIVGASMNDFFQD